MIICKNCGVELEADMENCPLCGQTVNDSGVISNIFPSYTHQPTPSARQMTAPQKKFTWEIVSLILLSASLATFVINFIINKRITWSEYPVAISLIIFSYVSLFAFWRRRTLIQIAGGFVLSLVSISIVDAVTGGIDWALILGAPMLLAVNLVIAVLINIVQTSKYKGINILAWGFIGATILCFFIDGILSYYKMRSVQLAWSIIVAGCILPVVLVLIFVHFRLKKGRNLNRTFHT